MRVRDGIRRGGALVVLGGLIAVAFGESVHYGFVNYDDPVVVVGNEAARGLTWDHLVQAFTGIHAHAWQPLYTASFWVDWAIGGGSPWAYHLMNLIWHGLAACLLFELLTLLGRERGEPLGRANTLAFIGAAIFAVHPVATESVAWVSGRKDLVAMTFSLAALLFFLNGVRGGRRTGWSVAAPVAFACALMAKASVFVLPLVAYGLLRVVERGREKPLARRTLLPLAGVSFVGLSVHLGVAASQGTIESETIPIVAKMIGMCAVFLQYLVHLVVPLDLSVVYEGRFDGAWHVDAVQGLVILVALVSATVFAVKRGAFVGLGLLWLLAGLLPFNNVFPQFSGVMADRYLHFSLAGFGLVIARALLLIDRSPRPFLALLVGATAVAFLVPLSRERTRVWESSEVLWRDAKSKAPNAMLPALQLGHALEERARTVEEPGEQAGLRREALAQYDEAERLARTRRERAQVVLLRAPLQVQQGHFEAALKDLDAAAMASRALGQGLETVDVDNLAVTRATALAGLGRLDEALEALGRVGADSLVRLQADRSLASLHLLRGLRALQSARSPDEESAGRTEYERGLRLLGRLARLHPRDRDVRMDEMKAWLGASWLAEAPIEVGKRARALVEDFPEDGEAWYLRARAYEDVDPELATQDLIRALDVDPHFERAYLLLARTLRARGSNRAAMGVLDRGLKALPDSGSLRREVAATWLAFGRHHQAARNATLALEAVNRSLELVPDQVDALVLRGDLHREQAQDSSLDAEAVTDHWRQSIKSYERALELDPRNREAKRGLAFGYRARGYGYLKASSRVRGRTKEAAEQRARIREDAMRAFRDALRLAGDDESFRSLARLLEDYGKELGEQARRARDEARFEDALGLVERALLFAPDDVDLLLLSAKISSDLGDSKDAARALEAALHRDPAHLQVLFELARLRLLQKDWVAVKDLCTRFLDLARSRPRSEALDEFIGAAERMRRHAEDRLKK
ncbi:MAG TPA: tetratricopeptide repeat protein [Planctomycetes bacterium]|nr:tetratricopeptide repeat protein [Planctomycetota bacterium]